MQALHATSRRAAVIAAVLLGALAGLPTGYAGASVLSKATGTEKLSSATWGVDSPGSIDLTNNNNDTVIFTVDNTGTLSLAAASYFVDVSGGGGYGNRGSSVTLTACVGGTWSTRSGYCNGRAVTIGTWTANSTAFISSTAVPAVGGSLSIEATANGGGGYGGGGTITATIDVTVTGGGSDSQLRSPLTTRN